MVFSEKKIHFCHLVKRLKVRLKFYGLPSIAWNFWNFSHFYDFFSLLLPFIFSSISFVVDFFFYFTLLEFSIPTLNQKRLYKNLTFISRHMSATARWRFIEKHFVVGFFFSSFEFSRNRSGIRWKRIKDCVINVRTVHGGGDRFWLLFSKKQ